MSRNLTNDRAQRKSTSSNETTTEEEASKNSNKIQKHRLIEEENQNSEEEDDEEEDTSEYSSSSSIPDEDINFDLVYTLHTFEATVDGQTTVKKGDALTLLDDSNSYWWLIRNLKSSEVGYIPAENIETPYERLARLNKHRNVELTSIEQAANCTSDSSRKPQRIVKKVKLSTSLDVQLQVLLTGENDEDVQDETYERWNEEMPSDDDEDDDDDSVTIHKATRIDLLKDNSKNKRLNSPNESEIQEQKSQHEPTQSTSRIIETPLNFKVIKVYAGNFDVGASYHSVRITESTSIDELLSNTLEKFHISEIETKQGRSYGKNSCVEYYLTVKTRDGDEMTLDSEDKPYAIHESLTTHLTTPMPSLNRLKQFNPSANNNSNKRRRKRAATSESSFQVYLHKRIKRVNDRSGQVHIKVSLMTTPKLNTPFEKTNTIKKMTAILGRNKKESRIKKERIDKLIATSENIIIADLISLALVKFHIIRDTEQPHQYRLILHCDGKDKLLDENQKLSDTLQLFKDQTKEKYFILHNSAINKEERSLSKSSSGLSSSSKVFPDNSFNTYPVMTRLDNDTEAILKRVDAALLTYDPISVPQPNRKDLGNPNFPSPMSVCRNSNGVDIHLPHGLLRSTYLPGNKIQYSLMKFPNTLVLQKIIPDDNSRDSSSVSGEELETLIKYGLQYLNAYDTAKSPSHYLRLAVDQNQVFQDKDSLSSLADLEKELYRIASSHTP